MDLYLAPMNLVSNKPFRKICLELGSDYVFSELIYSERILNDFIHEERKLDIIDDSNTIIQIISENENIEPMIKLLRLKFKNIKEINLKKE